jgi:hypothetical protein
VTFREDSVGGGVFVPEQPPKPNAVNRKAIGIAKDE